MKVMVTGGAGFIGSHVVDGLIDKGHDVVVLDNLSTGRMENLNPRAAFYLGDIRARETEKIFEIEKIDALCHHAAQMDVRKSVENPLFDAEVNILGALHLFQLCVRFHVRKIVFASTGGAVYGEQKVFPCDEEHPTYPLSPYGISKLITERYLYYYHAQFGIPYVVLRYANVYGPRQNTQGEAGVVAIFTHMLLTGQQPVINGDGKQTRDYLYVADVARANLLAIDHDRNDLFNIGTGIETDVNTIFDHLNRLTGEKHRPFYGPPKMGEQQRSVISAAKAEKTWGWKSEVPLEEGLKRTVLFFRGEFR